MKKYLLLASLSFPSFALGVDLEAEIIKHIHMKNKGSVEYESINIPAWVKESKCLAKDVTTSRYDLSRLTVDVHCENNLKRNFYAKGSGFVKALTYSKPVKRGTKLTAQNTKINKIDINKHRVSIDFYKDFLPNLSYSTKKRMKADDIVYPKYLNPSFTIEKGNIIYALYSVSENMNIKAKAVALESGMEGDIIMMENTNSKINFSGKIINRNSVRVK